MTEDGEGGRGPNEVDKRPQSITETPQNPNESPPTVAQNSEGTVKGTPENTIESHPKSTTVEPIQHTDQQTTSTTDPHTEQAPENTTRQETNKPKDWGTRMEIEDEEDNPRYRRSKNIYYEAEYPSEEYTIKHEHYISDADGEHNITVDVHTTDEVNKEYLDTDDNTIMDMLIDDAFRYQGIERKQYGYQTEGNITTFWIEGYEAGSEMHTRLLDLVTLGVIPFQQRHMREIDPNWKDPNVK